jgi:hypothetical protein
MKPIKNSLNLISDYELNGRILTTLNRHGLCYKIVSILGWEAFGKIYSPLMLYPQENNLLISIHERILK